MGSGSIKNMYKFKLNLVKITEDYGSRWTSYPEESSKTRNRLIRQTQVG